MSIRQFGLSVVVVSLAACSEPPPPPSAEAQFVDDVATALGGAEAFESVTTYSMEGSGRMLNVGQDLTPEAATMVFDITDYRLSADLANERSRTSMVRTPLFDYFRGRDPMYLVSGIDGNVAYDVGPDGTARRAHDDVAADRRANYFHHPLPLLRAVITGSASVSNVRDDGDLTLADVSTSDGYAITLAVDGETSLPAYTQSTDYHFYLQDVVRRTRFADYASAGSLSLPTQISQSIDEFQAFTLDVSAQMTNAAIDNISAPESAATSAAISGAAPVNVVETPLAEGVWLLAGQSHHSVLVEFSDHLMVIEAPNEGRVLGVIAKADELVPGKPVTQVVNTHHHFDHSGGIRAAVSEGLTIITQAANEAFYRRMAEQPSTIKPDALARSPRPIAIETVDEHRTYEDESMTVELFHVADNPHSSSILMAYIPEHRLLVQVDLFTLGRTTPQLFAPNLLDNIVNYGLEVETIVPLHGERFDIDALRTAVAELRN